jgi:hypothetical protein
VTHGTQVVDFLRLDPGNDADEIGGVAQVTVMQKKFDSSIMTILVNVIDASSVETRGATDNTMDLKEKECTVSRVSWNAIHRIHRSTTMVVQSFHSPRTPFLATTRQDKIHLDQ